MRKIFAEGKEKIALEGINGWRMMDEKFFSYVPVSQKIGTRGNKSINPESLAK